jgi:hypothetical protein
MRNKTMTRKNNQSKKRRRMNVFKKLKKTTIRALPIVESGLKKVGKSVEFAAEKSAPIVNKGLEGIYGTLATGFEMGAKRVKNVIKTRRRSRSRR